MDIKQQNYEDGSVPQIESETLGIHDKDPRPQAGAPAWLAAATVGGVFLVSAFLVAAFVFLFGLGAG
ncbi:hypothetical protein [Mucisphaera sp.]|uniref:hypothetical protein n=1 Tax=Mucisphaera sp. TaxID=2913024 RepID=UPI003D0EC563